MNEEFKDTGWKKGATATIDGKVRNDASALHANGGDNNFTRYYRVHSPNEDIFKVITNSKKFIMAGQSSSESRNDGESMDSFPRKGESPFLAPFFNFFFYIYLVPFKLELAKEKTRYHLRAHKLHRIICGLAHCLIIASLIYLTITSILVMIGSDPSTLIVAIFEFMSNLSGTILAVLVLYMFWRNDQVFLEIINMTRVSYDTISPRQMKTFKRSISIVTFLITIALMIIAFFLLTEAGHYLSESKSTNVTTELPELSSDVSGGAKFMETVGTILMIAAFMYSSAIFPLSQGMFPMMTLALRQLGKEFEIDLEKTFTRFTGNSNLVDERIRKGIKLHRTLKGTTEEIKNLFGAQLLAFCVTSVTYYAEAPHVLLGKRGHVEKAMLAYFMLTAVVWFLAAEFHHHVKDVLFKWLEIHTDLDELSTNLRLRLMSIQNEANSDPVALQNKYFTVTYGYLSSLLSLVVTYGIIVFQLHQDDGSKVVIDPRPHFHS